MNKNSISFGVIGLIIGLAIGFFVTNSINKNATPQKKTVQTPNAPLNNAQPQGQSPQGVMQVDVQKTLDRAAKEPQNFKAQIEAGKMYQRIQNFDKALVFFQNAQKIKPDDFGVNALLGNAYFDARQFENAETYYERALEINPKEVSVRSDLATTFVQRNQPDYERAFSEFEKALALDSQHEATIFNMGIAYLRKGEKDKAKEALTKLKEAEPNSDLISTLENFINE